MAQMAVQTTLDVGTFPTLSAANTNDTAAVGDGNHRLLVVKNGSGSSITVTLSTYVTEVNGQALPSWPVTVAAGATALIPLRKIYDKGDGTGAQILYSAVTTVTSGLLQVQ